MPLRAGRFAVSLLTLCVLGQAQGCTRTAPSTLKANDAGSGAARLTAEQAESAARTTPIARAFLDRYAPCDGCLFEDPPGAPQRIGCVSYRVRESCPGDHSECPEMAWVVNYWVGTACPFRYQPSEIPVSVSIDPATGAVLEVMPEPNHVIKPTYCDRNADCRCLSGSGVPFVGCANWFHASMHATGASACDACSCANHECEAATK